jgi:hypothetical protein
MLYDALGEPLRRGIACERNDIAPMVSPIWRRARVPCEAHDDEIRHIIDASVKASISKPIVRTFRIELVKRRLVETLVILLLLTTAIAPAYARGGHGGGHHYGRHP